MIRVAVIGTNNIGKVHCRFYAQNPDVQLVAVCDIIKERADALAVQHGATAYYSVPELLAAERLDAVSVATAGVENGSQHYEPTMQALEAGVNVLCEKPISNNIDEARAMVARAKERGLRLGVNLNHRFVPAAWRAREWVQEGRLGDLLFCNMALWINNPNESAEYFHLRALHPHSIDVMRYFCGDVDRVQAFFTKAPGRKIWSTASLNLHFANGVVGHLSGSYDMTGFHPIERCEVAGTKGRFVIENVYEQLTFFPRQSPEKVVVANSIMGGMGSFNDTFKNRIDKFVEQLIKGEPIDGSGEEALAAQEVIEAAIRSHERGTIEKVMS
jgi:predicted dehydrogenase